jgi:hypothetical protein
MENYKIAIGISLTNGVSGVLGLIARDFIKADAEAVKFRRTLNDIKLLAAGGAVMAGVGFMGLKALKDTLEPAREYAHQLSVMNNMGFHQVEIAQAIGDAWKTTGEVMTTTATENLRSLTDLRNILISQEREQYGAKLPAKGTREREAIDAFDWQASRAALPAVARMEAALKAASPKLFGEGDEAREFAFSAAKALDIRGAVQDPKRFQEELERMGQVGIWSENRITPEMYRSVLFYARQANMSLSPDFLYGILPSLMIENANGGQGGGSRGIGPALAAGYRAVVQGYGINKMTLPLLEDMGLVGPHASLKTTTQGTTVGGMTGADLFSKDPAKWARDVFDPRMKSYMKQHHIQDTPENELAIIGQVSRGNQLFGWALGQYVLKQSQELREQERISQSARPTEAFAYDEQHDPDTMIREADAQWKNLKTVIGTEVLPTLIPAIQELTKGLHAMADWAGEPGHGQRAGLCLRRPLGCGVGDRRRHVRYCRDQGVGPAG